MSASAPLPAAQAATVAPARKKIDIGALARKKRAGEPITMLTCYDCPSARLLDACGIDTLLVGDSAGNVVLGHRDTVPVTMEEMLLLTRSVARGTQYAMVIGDMPFGSYQVSREEALRNAARFMKESLADAVKLEGGGDMADTVRFMVRAGVPVVGHLGLTPQSAALLGGYRVQGKSFGAAKAIVEDALRLQDAGIFALVVECIPHPLGALLSRRLEIPVIGIGAGPQTDGQVLVLHDMLGIQSGFAPKFVRRFGAVAQNITEAVNAYGEAVRQRGFPATAESFPMDDAEWAKLEAWSADAG